MEVRLKTLEGRWEQVGRDRLSNIYPEGIQATANEHGSDTCRFSLRRDPGGEYPDLAAFTPCEILRNGVVVWSGRVWETPTKEGADSAISVEGRGWQYHLDDHLYAFPYARITMDFKDVREQLEALLGYFTASGQVVASNGSVSIGWSKDTVIALQEYVGVVYDLGPEYEKFWPDFYIEFTNFAVDPNINVYVRAHNIPEPLAVGADYTDLYFNGVPSINAQGGTIKQPMTASVPRRYISVFMEYAGGGGTFGQDNMVQIKQFSVYGKPQYRDMVDQSYLLASDLMQDAIERAAPLLKPTAARTPPFRDMVLGNPTLSGYYSFDALEAINGVSNSIRDQGPYGRHIAMGGTPAISAGLSVLDNQFGTETNRNSIVLNGDWGLTTMPFSNGGRVSVAGIFAASTLPQYGMIFHIGNPGTNGWGLWISGGAGGPTTGSNLFILKGSIAWVDTGITLSAGDYYVFTMKYTQDYAGKQIIVKLWDTNGVLFDQFYHSATLAPPVTPASEFRIGGNPSADNSQSIIDEIAVFDAPLDEYADGTGYYEERLVQSAVDKQDGTVAQTSFWIPEYGMPTAATPREVIEGANSFHDYIWKINHEPALELYPRPTNGEFEVGRWSGAEFEEASANAGEEIYNMVRVEATDPQGRPLVVERGGLQDSDNVLVNAGTFGAGIGSWTVFDPTKSAIAQATPPTPSPAGQTYAGRVSVTAGPHSPTAINNSFTGTFKPGRLYRARAYMYRTTHTADIGEFYVTNTIGGETETITKPIPYGGLWAGAGAGFWFPIYVDFSFDAIGTVALNIMQITDGTNNIIFWIDDIKIQELPESLPTSYGFIRSKSVTVNATSTQAALEKIGDTWLEGRTSTPFHGSLTHTIPAGIRRTRTGAHMHPADMLNHTGEKILFAHRSDPDTGDWGRHGAISTVSYDDNTGVSTISIDSTRASFEALLSRYAAVVGTIR